MTFLQLCWRRLSSDALLFVEK